MQQQQAIYYLAWHDVHVLRRVTPGTHHADTDMHHANPTHSTVKRPQPTGLYNMRVCACVACVCVCVCVWGGGGGRVQCVGRYARMYVFNPAWQGTVLSIVVIRTKLIILPQFLSINTLEWFLTYLLYVWTAPIL